MSFMKTRLIPSILILTLMLSALVMVPVANAQEGPPQVGQRPDAPPYALHGSYWVGTQTMEMDAGTTDALRFTVWYPALNPERAEEAVTYVMAENHVLRQMLPPEAPFTVLGHALDGAAPDLSAAPYPLVVFSHGFTAPMWYMYVGEHLASYGFVVIAPEHAQDSWDHVYTSHIIRLFDIKRTIADAETLNFEGGALAGMIDVERIAVGGHSSGGTVAYGAAGVPVDWSSIVEMCKGFADVPDCADLEGQYQAIAALVGSEADANGLFPAVWDSRVDAIFPMAGTMEMAGQQGLAALTLPMLALFGSSDPMASLMAPAYDDTASAPKAQVIFENGGHGVFYQPCDVFPYLVDYGLFWGCADEVWDLRRTNDLINHFLTAFLLATLKGDADAAAALAPAAVQFPGITYEATGF